MYAVFQYGHHRLGIGHGLGPVDFGFQGNPFDMGQL